MTAKGKPAGLTLEFDDELADSINELSKAPIVSVNGTVYAGKVMISTTSCTLGGRTMTLDPQTLEPLEGAKLGSGSSGMVKRVRHTVTGQVLALKEIRINSEHHLIEIQKELETLHQGVASQHTNLIDFYGAYHQEGCVYIAMECMDGSLAEFRSPIPETVLAKIAKQVLTGLAYLHTQRHLIHRDIKPSNLLYNVNGHIKITDFGVSSQVESTAGCATSFVGTVTYMAPERLRGDAHGSVVDIWALGISIVELALGAHPFKEIVAEAAGGSEAKFWSLLSHLNSATTGCGVDLARTPFSNSLKDFLTLACEKDHSKRPGAKTLLDHPWVVSNTSQNEQENEVEIAAWIQAARANSSPTSKSKKLSAALDLLATTS